jgi:hypothetical protein
MPEAAAPAPAALEVEQPPRLFELPEQQVPRAPVAVEVHHLGFYKFKGSPQPLQMVNVTLASLSGRLLLLPSAPPKGKGDRVSAKSGLAASCELAIPSLAQAYRAHVPQHILQQAELIPALHPIPSSPRRQISAALRAASMPSARGSNNSNTYRSSDYHYGSGGGGSSSSVRRNRPPALALQQLSDLQLAAMEGGELPVPRHSSTPCSPSAPSPKPPKGSAAATSARSSSFSARLWPGKAAGIGSGSSSSRVPGQPNGMGPGHQAWSPAPSPTQASPAASAAVQVAVGESGSSGGAAAGGGSGGGGCGSNAGSSSSSNVRQPGDVVLQVSPDTPPSRRA